MSSSRRSEKKSSHRQSNNRTLPPSRRNDEDDTDDIRPPSIGSHQVNSGPEFSPDATATSSRRSNENDKKEEESTAKSGSKRSKQLENDGSSPDKPASVSRKVDDGPEFSPDSARTSNSRSKEKKESISTILKGGGRKRSKKLDTDGPGRDELSSASRKRNDGPEFTPDTSLTRKRRQRNGEDTEKKSTIPEDGGKGSKAAHKGQNHSAKGNDEKVATKATRPKEQFESPGVVLSSGNHPQAQKMKGSDQAELSPDNEAPNQSQDAKESASGIAKGGASGRKSDGAARRQPLEEDVNDEKFAAKVSYSGQAATAPGVVFSDKPPQDKILKGENNSDLDEEDDEKIAAKAGRSGQSAKAHPGIVYSDEPAQDKSIKGSDQPELTPLDGDMRTSERRAESAIEESEGQQSVNGDPQSTASTDVLSPNDGESPQPTGETTTTTTFRPRPPVSNTQVGAHRVAGLDGENGPDDTDDIFTVVSAPALNDGTSSLPVARMADDSSEGFLDDLAEAEPLSPEDLKNQGIKGWIRQHKVLAATAVFIVIGAIVGGAVGAALGGASPPPEPTFAPTFSPTAAPTLEGFEELVDTLTTITPYSILTDPSTPQNAAVTWLMRDDEYDGVDFDDAPKLLERYALATIYFATVGTEWTSQFQFLTNQDVCLWNGVGVDNSTFGVRECNEQGLVTKLALSSNGLQGTLPEEISGMPLLVEFGAAINSMSGSIPKGLTALTNLLEIYLFECGVSGTIPQEIGNLAKLTYLAMQRNSLSGTIPASLYDLTNLKDLFLVQNRLSGTIPTEVGNLSLLRQWWLEGNEFSGSVPSDVSRMTSLSTIYMNQNDFTGGMENFCTGSISFSTFYSDCYANEATVLEASVECSCCTVCCFYRESSSGCVPNDGTFDSIGG